MRIAVIFDNFGPYHLARLVAASRRCELLGIEVVARSAEYGWAPSLESTSFRRETLVTETDSAKAGRSAGLARHLEEVLCSFEPAAVAIPGWSSRAAFLSLHWCIRKHVPAIVMSESQANDEVRYSPKEWVKRRCVNACGSALVGGVRHREYLIELGMAADRICIGYDVVDNDYFASKADSARANRRVLSRNLSLPEHYFLASNRFIAKKNLPLILRAFARYRQNARGTAWDLVLLGDGPLRSRLESLVADLDLEARVHLPGFTQYNELPLYYGLAGAFVHASTTEQWGLVVNEAMASGLPVVVSNRCGCAPELVADGTNGFQFDPNDETVLAQHMMRLASDKDNRLKMGQASRERIRQWGPDRFAEGLTQAAEKAVQNYAPVQRWSDSILMRLLAIR